jgi:DNA-binding SARP family transcriptional activator/TolB-like protein
VATSVEFPPPTSAFELRLLGPMTLLHSRQVLDLPPSRKARALLALLALSPRPMPREQLCEMLWGRPSDPRAELRGALSKLRVLLDDPSRKRVLANARGVHLDLSDAAIDVRELESQVRGGTDSRAMPAPAMHASGVDGEFLEGLEIDRAPIYGQWLLAERRRWRSLQVALLERMADQFPPQSDEAIECLTRWLRLLPHDRRAHERLLDALARRGQLREGDAHLATAVRLFEGEGQDAADLVRVWRLARDRHGGSAARVVVRDPPPLGGEPTRARRGSVAVMPFEELPHNSASGLGRYLAHDVTTRLAKLRSLFVIDPASTSALEARGMGAEAAARVLDVDYVVSGMLRRDRGHIALSAQLIHTRSARVVWADSLRAVEAEPFDVLDELGDQLVAAIADQVELAERQRAVLKAPESLDAWEAHHRGLWHMYRFRREENELARRWFETATRLEPGFSRPHAGLSFTHWQNAFQGWGDRERETELAWRHANEGLMADDQDPAIHWALGRAHWLRGQVAESLAELNHSVSLSPNFSQGHYALAFVHSQSGDASAAIASADHARALSPFDPMLFAMLATRAMALMRLGRMDEAADWAVRASSRPNAHQHIRGIAAHCLELAGRHDEALRVVMALRREHPGYSTADFLQAFHFADDGERPIRRAAVGIGLA